MTESASSTSSSNPTGLYDNIGRQAWLMLWLAAATFLCILIGAPVGIRWYWHNATRPLPTTVEAIRGTTLILNTERENTQAVVEATSLRPSQIISTDENARANVTVFDRATPANTVAVIQLRSNSELLFLRASTPRFRSSSLIHRVNLRLNGGRARMTGSANPDRPLEITVETPHAVVRLRDAADAAIAVTNENTEVNARGGEVEVEAQGRLVLLNNGRRSITSLNQPPSDPMPSAINLVKNGDFSQALAETWQTETLVDAQDLSTVTFGEVRLIENSDRRAVYFVREGEDAIHTETAIVQEINADVLDYDSLVLRMDVLLLSQSLPGGGQQSSEFPVMARIDFIDVNGNARFWTHGFYAVDPVANWPIRDGEKIPNFVWFDYESPDFLNSPTFPRPQKVTSIRIYASGHNYRSQVAGIGLIAR